jgi:hypothetical protein
MALELHAGAVALYEHAFRLMHRGVMLSQEDAARSARRLVDLVNADPAIMATVYLDLIPLIKNAAQAPWPAVEAAVSLGLILEQLRRAPAMELAKKVRAGLLRSADARRKGDRWRVEVEQRPSSTKAAAIYQEIADREGLEYESVKRAVTRARKAARLQR